MTLEGDLSFLLIFDIDEKVSCVCVCVCVCVYRVSQKEGTILRESVP